MLGGGDLSTACPRLSLRSFSSSVPPTLPSLLIRPMVIDKPVTDEANAEQRDGIWTRGRIRPRLPVFDLFWGLVFYFTQLSPGLLNFSRENQNHMGSIRLEKPKFLPVRRNVCLVNFWFSHQMTTKRQQIKTRL